MRSGMFIVYVNAVRNSYKVLAKHMDNSTTLLIGRFFRPNATRKPSTALSNQTQISIVPSSPNWRFTTLPPTENLPLLLAETKGPSNKQDSNMCRERRAVAGDAGMRREVGTRNEEQRREGKSRAEQSRASGVVGVSGGRRRRR